MNIKLGLLIIIALLQIKTVFASTVETGLDFEYKLSKQELNYTDQNMEKISPSTMKSHEININPRVSIAFNKKFVLAPSLLLNITILEMPITGKRNDIAFGFGLAEYFRVIYSKYFRVSLGGNLEFVNNPIKSDIYSYTTAGFLFSVKAPINIDLLLGSILGLRLSSDIIALDIYHYNESTNDYNDVDFNVKGILSPSFGLFLKLKKRD